MQVASLGDISSRRNKEVVTVGNNHVGSGHSAKAQVKIDNLFKALNAFERDGEDSCIDTALRVFASFYGKHLLELEKDEYGPHISTNEKLAKEFNFPRALYTCSDGQTYAGMPKLPGQDHTWYYRNSGPDKYYKGEEVFCVTNPYHLHLNELKSMVKVCEEQNLEVCIDGASPYFPGSTVRVTYSSKIMPKSFTNLQQEVLFIYYRRHVNKDKSFCGMDKRFENTVRGLCDLGLLAEKTNKSYSSEGKLDAFDITTFGISFLEKSKTLISKYRKFRQDIKVIS